MNAKFIKSNLSKCGAPVRCFRKLTVKYDTRNTKNKGKINGYCLQMPVDVVSGWNVHDLLVECLYDAQSDLLVVGPVSKVEKWLTEE